jgi:hypothetical protein
VITIILNGLNGIVSISGNLVIREMHLENLGGLANLNVESL